jgi:hypothetical protein
MLILTALLLAQPHPLQDSSPPLRVWAAGSTEKIQDSHRAALPHEGVFNSETKTVKLSGVRGEHVPFQLIVTADHVEAEGVWVEPSPLHADEAILPAEQIEVFFEHMVKVYAPTGAHGARGMWPDALIPLERPFDIRSARRSRGPVRRHQPLWVDVLIPRDQAPGTYSGTVQVTVEGEELDSISLELEVLDVELPRARQFPVLMGFFYGRDIARLHELEHGSDEFRALWLEYLRFLLSFGADPTFIDLGVKGRVEEGEYVLEWTDPELEELLATCGQTRFALGASPPGLSREGLTEEEHRAHVHSYLAQATSHAREAGWENRLVFLAPVDEPQSKEEYEAVRYWGELLHSYDPSLRLAVTEQPVPEDPAWGTLVGACNEWIVHGSFLDDNSAAIRERQAEGDRVSWYVSCDQLYPQPNYYIDREAADMRMLGWITWRYRLGGLLYWSATKWSEVRDPFIDAISWKRSHCNAPAAGEGMLLYPGNLVEEYTGQPDVYGAVASLRLALLREGCEELELLGLLADSGQPELADELAASLCGGVRAFTRDPDAIDSARERLLRALARL